MNEILGQALSIGALGNASIWAITNSSIYAIRKFTRTPEDIDDALDSMKYGLGLSFVWSTGMGLLTKSMLVFVISLLLAIIFFLLYMWELSKIVVKYQIVI